ncbi:MAG: PAS domain-containing protein [SAR324 cluster bacterium]|nr:PAS domain-containing protein [SAR324 cluster bacterium]
MPRKKTTPQKIEPEISKTASGNKQSPLPVDDASIPDPVISPEENDFFVVGIGASAGGLAALEQFFLNLSTGNNVAVVVVSHLDPSHVSILPALIQKSTKLKVFQIEDGMALQADCVYVIPANKEVVVMNRILLLNTPTSEHGPRMSIDTFFDSLAQDQKEKAIGIILSGMGTDGTLGLKAIKAELGLTMAQDPTTAQSNSMPQSAINTNLIDFVLPPEQMPATLILYTKKPYRKILNSGKAISGDVPVALQKIYRLLRSHVGHDFSNYKENTICRRIERRMHVHHLDTIDQYVSFLQQKPPEIRLLFTELLIGVTHFFRDPEAFQILEQNLRSCLQAKTDDASVRIWVPGCSTGEEAYSIAIMVRECMEQISRHFPVQIFATDIDEDAINQARTGVYPQGIENDVAPAILKRFFTRDDNGYRIKKDIREMVVFATQNVIKDPPFTKLDLLSCRNMLIYFNSDLQKKLMPVFHYSLKPEGLLFLGSSESIGGFTELFSAIDRKWKLHQRKDAIMPGIHSSLEFPLQTLSPDAVAPQQAQPNPQSLARIIEKILLDEYALPSLVINEKGMIVYVHGDTARYLSLPSGEAKTNNVFEMARDRLKLELPAAVHKALNQKSKTIVSGLSINNGVDSQTSSSAFNLIIQPLTMPGSINGLLLISFQQIASPDALQGPRSKARSRKKSIKSIDLLEQDLQYTRETLQSTIEEMETANEELKSSNEEMQSTNEELQSTNEELETAKEEQNSLNEELVTVNTELQSKIEELSKAANDMKNLLDGTEIPTVFLDTHLNINRFTTHATRIINLIPTDAGRPLSDIANKFLYENMVQDAKQVLDNLIPRKVEIETRDGQWYIMKIIPYRTLENVIEGVVMTFSQITEQKKLNEKLQRHIQQHEVVENALKISDDRYKLIATLSNEGIFQLDPAGTIVFTNKRFAEIFGDPLKSFVGLNGLELTGIESTLQEKILQLQDGQHFEGESEGIHDSGHTIKLFFRTGPIYDKTKVVGIIGTIQTFTD